MPKGVPVERDFRVMVHMVIKERRVALPASRLIWYATKFFRLPITAPTAKRILRKMVREGVLVVIADGKWRYYKNFKK